MTDNAAQTIVVLTNHQVDAGLAGKKIMSRTPKNTEIQLRWHHQPLHSTVLFSLLRHTQG